jgi:hypothetical protein
MYLGRGNVLILVFCLSVFSKSWPSELCHCVVMWKNTNVSERHAASAMHFTLEMEVALSSETLESYYITTRRHKSERPGSDVKGKEKLSMCLNKQHVIKTYCESGGIAPCILSLRTRWR